MITLWVFMGLVVLAAILIAFNNKYKIVFTIGTHNRNLDIYLAIKRALYKGEPSSSITYMLLVKYNVPLNDGYHFIVYAQQDNIEFFKELGR